MTRTISANAQTALDTDLGVEPIVVIEIFWASTDGTATGPSSLYADRALENGTIKGAILDMTDFDEAVQVTGGGQAASFSLTLDDTDGTIKAVFDANDIHKAPVKVWLFPKTDDTTFTADKVPIFQGQVNSPVVWSEGQRTLALAIVNRIEDKEVGFSAEEGEFSTLPEELIGQTWPLCFGTTVNVKCLKAVPAISGKLQGGVGIADFTLPTRISLAEAITCPQTPIGFQCKTTVGSLTYSATCTMAFETDQNCLQARCVEIERLNLMLSEQKSYEYNNITIIGGEEFPQGRRIQLNINGGLFTGKFNGTLTSPTNVFTITRRQHPDFDPSTGTVLTDDFENAIDSACPGADYEAQDSDFTDGTLGPVFTGLRSSRISWENYRTAKASSFFWAGGGSTVALETSKEIIYVANIVPSTILRVAAWRVLNGNRFLLTVPSKYFTTREVDYGGYSVMEVVFERALSSEDQDSGGGWSDDIYVTQISSVGPNTVDIIEWFIDTYTSYSKDSTSFTDVKAALENYPMHFALTTRPNLIHILQDIAQKARCALWQKLDTFYIKYLAEEPTSEATITEDDILTNDQGIGSMQISLTDTVDLVTKLTCRWRKDYSLDEDFKLILRHNVIKYGTHAREEDYFPYGHLDLVRKSATFWLIRWANTWKRVRFSTSLEFLKLEPFDCITLDLPDVASTTFKAVVEKATLDTTGKQINFDVWTPIRAGETTPYDFAWPAQIAEHSLFPNIQSINSGQAGSGTDPNFSTISPPGHPLTAPTPGVVTGVSLSCNGAPVQSWVTGECRQDHGDREPSDIGDVKPTVDVTADTTAGISDGTRPVTNGTGSQYGGAQWVANQYADKVAGDAGRGREYSSINDDNNEGDGHGTNDQENTTGITDEFLDDLPDPNDLSDCHYDVTVGGIAVTYTPVAGGHCVPAPANPNRTEVYSFDNLAAAVEFCETINENDQGCQPPDCSFCITSCNISGPLGDCSDGEGEQGLVGFRRDEDYDEDSYMGGFA